MPIHSLSSTEAARNLRANARGLWPDGRRRGQRLEGVADIACQPTFSFSKDDRIMTIGSCFAREVESALEGLGFVLPTLRLEIPGEERVSEIPNDILNKYTVQSMANEIEWAFAPPAVPDTDLFVTAGEGLWHDPHLVHNLKPASLERVKTRREAVLGIMRELPNCRIVVVTLGLAEAWFDTKLGLYLNSMPPQPAIAAEPERFRLDVLGFDDIVSGIERLLALFARFGHPDHKVLMTVSPVPFKATFSGQDALAANCYSKAVQRAAVEATVRRHPNVDYFPSYEIVTLTDRKVAFKLDNIHVAEEVIAEIMRRLVAGYVTGHELQAADVVSRPHQSREEHNVEGVLSRGYVALEGRDYAAAVASFASILYRYGDNLTAVERDSAFTGLVRSTVLAGRLTEAHRHNLRWQEVDPESAVAAATMAKVLEKLKKPGRAIEQATRACELQPHDPGALMRLAALLVRCGEPERAVEVAGRALALDPALEAARDLIAKHRTDQASDAARSASGNRP